MSQETQTDSPALEPAAREGASLVRPVALRLVERDAEGQCQFWVGLCAPGNVPPGQLMAERDIATLFQIAAQKGVAESPPLLLTDAQSNPPRYVYLLGTPRDEFKERAMWTA